MKLKLTIGAGCLLSVIFSVASAHEPGSIVQATSDTFACGLIDDVADIDAALKNGDNSRLSNKVSEHVCVNISRDVPWQVQHIESTWIMIGIPGVPGMGYWSPGEKYAPGRVN